MFCAWGHPKLQYVDPACHNRTHKAQALMGEAFDAKGCLSRQDTEGACQVSVCDTLGWEQALLLTVKGMSIGVDDCGSLLIWIFQPRPVLSSTSRLCQKNKLLNTNISLTSIIFTRIKCKHKGVFLAAALSITDWSGGSVTLVTVGFYMLHCDLLTWPSKSLHRPGIWAIAGATQLQNVNWDHVVFGRGSLGGCPCTTGTGAFSPLLYLSFLPARPCLRAVTEVSDKPVSPVFCLVPHFKYLSHAPNLCCSLCCSLFLYLKALLFRLCFLVSHFSIVAFLAVVQRFKSQAALPHLPFWSPSRHDVPAQ